MDRVCGKKLSVELLSTFYNKMQHPHLLQDRFDSGVVRRATSLFNSGLGQT